MIILILYLSGRTTQVSSLRISDKMGVGSMPALSENSIKKPIMMRKGKHNPYDLGGIKL